MPDPSPDVSAIPPFPPTPPVACARFSGSLLVARLGGTTVPAPPAPPGCPLGKLPVPFAPLFPAPPVEEAFPPKTPAELSAVVIATAIAEIRRRLEAVNESMLSSSARLK
jgi:hypothetical protein